MQGEQNEWVVPEDAVFELAAHTPHDSIIRPTASGAMHLEGSGAKGDVVEYLHFDEVDRTFTHELRADIEPTLNDVARMHLEQGHNAGKNKAGDWYLAARVDRIVIDAWLNKLGLKWRDFKGDVVERFLNDSDNSAFRVWRGRV